VIDAGRLKERTSRMLEHALELAAQGSSLEKIETLLHYAGYADARQRLWWPIVCREVSAAAERARPSPGDKRRSKRGRPRAWLKTKNPIFSAL
jgi:hypothetical protein